MDKDDSVNFTDDQFKYQNKDVAWLCQTIRSEGYEPSFVSAPENTVEWLNQMLSWTKLFECLIAKKSSVRLTDEMRRLRDETAKNRKNSFEVMSPLDQKAVRRLNRLSLETAYPRETPKCRYRLTGMIKTGNGNNFLQEYQTSEDFKRDMQQHKHDIEWGLLVRADTGTVIDEYYSDLGDREKIGLNQIEPRAATAPEGLSPKEAALREAAMRHFKSNKRKRFILGQMAHINGSLQLTESIRFLFDQNGKPGVLPPLEDIIAEREKIEVKIRWMDAISTELRNALASLQEVEEGVLEQLGQGAGRT